MLSMRLREIQYTIHKYINITYPAFRNPCGITDSKTLALLLRKMSGGLDKKVSFIHEMGHHDEVLYKDSNYKNNLLEYENPTQILRIAWFTCKELLKIINEDTSDITSLREKQYKMIDKIIKLSLCSLAI